MDQRQMAESLLGALAQARGQVVNTDSDGLISALLVSRLALENRGRPLPIVGFYDNERLWLSPDITLESLLADPAQVVFVDADVRLSGAVVVSQHVVHHAEVEALREPPDGVLLLNPNYMDVARMRPYRFKYPFSTAAWVWALWPEGLPVPGPNTQILTGLLWAQDGGHESVAENRFRQNCLEWATELVADFPLAPAAHALRGLAADAKVGPYLRDEAILERAKAAETEIRQQVGAAAGAGRGWQSQQWCFAARQRVPLVDPAAADGRQTIQRFLDVVAELIGIPTVVVEPTRLAARGTWREVRPTREQVDWASAFSLAKTYRDRIACTLDLYALD